MTKKRLDALQAKSQSGDADLSDVVEILYEMYLAQSLQNRDLKTVLKEYSDKIGTLEEHVAELVRYTSVEPIAAMLLENMRENDAEANFDGEEHLDNEDAGEEDVVDPDKTP